MAMSSVPKIRNLQHTSFEELDLDDEELAAFHRTQAAVVAEILIDPLPSKDDFDR